ncbi:MAG: pyridoxal 5'-phosphate synthase glutaminase subunit PdxT [Spirochaetales bacterium]|nr:pyridoxal 5'-phosphate synthase glutaminase subunit PdxT [Spirochaetales bacterium]
MKKIGILSLQGDSEKHFLMTESAGAQPVLVKTLHHLEQVHGLIIPGGESTTIGKLLDRFSLLEPLKTRIQNGFPVFGTCAGAILLAKEIEHSHQLALGTMDITLSRNAYGPQIESFETDIIISLPEGRKDLFRAIFIRAPIITRVGKNCEILSIYQKKPVLVREHNMLVATFHPELTDNAVIHSYFLSMLKEYKDN